MSDKMGFKHSFLDWGFCFHNTGMVLEMSLFLKK